MSQSGAIITFQVGTYANFVGAHLFNLQDPLLDPENGTEFNPNVLWTERVNLQRKRAWTPRVLMFDLKENWAKSFVRRSGDIPDLHTVIGSSAHSTESGLDKIEKDVSWHGRVQRVVAVNDSDSDDESEARSDGALRNNTNVKKKVKLGEYDFSSWGDYTKWRLHSTDNYAFRIPNFMYNAESEKLVSYGQGLDVYHKIEESVMDGIRHYAEDCDYLDGFHMLVDEYDGFTGIAGGIMEHLSDEYDKKACLGLGLNHPISGGSKTVKEPSLKDYKIRISNTAQLWTSFSRHARVFTSFGICDNVFSLSPEAKRFTSVIQDCTLPAVSSSILAATLDTLTAPYRIPSASLPLHEMTSLLNAFGHKMTAIGSALPFPMNKKSLFSTLNEQELSSITSLTPNVSLELDKSVGNLIVSRGIKSDQVINKLELRECKDLDIRNVTSCLELYCQESYPKSVNVVKNVTMPFKSVHPFPSLFDVRYLESNAIERKFTRGQGECWLLPAVASAHNTPAIGQILEKMVSVTGGGAGGSMMKMKAFYYPSSETCNSTVVEFEDYADGIHDLCNLRDTYSQE